MFLSEIGLGIRESSGTPLPRIPSSASPGYYVYCKFVIIVIISFLKNEDLFSFSKKRFTLTSLISQTAKQPLFESSRNMGTCDLVIELKFVKVAPQLILRPFL